MESTRREQESELERGLVTSTINALACDDKLEAITFKRVKEATKNDTELTILAQAKIQLVMKSYPRPWSTMKSTGRTCTFWMEL